MSDATKSNIAIDPEELSVANKEAANSGDSFTYKFRKTYEYDGKNFNEVTFNWDRLTGNDALAIENELQQLGKAIIVPAFSGEYLVRMCARACTEGIGADFFGKMPIADYNRIRSAARSFLLKSES